MCRKCLVLICLPLLLLVGCGKTEPEAVEEPEVILHTVSESFDDGTVSMNSITPTTAFETVDEEVHIFPFYNSDKYISLKKVFISDNGFWDTMTSAYTDTNNLKSYDKYKLITTEAGKSIVMLPYGDDSALLIESSDLPSGYVKAVADALCK